MYTIKVKRPVEPKDIVDLGNYSTIGAKEIIYIENDKMENSKFCPEKIKATYTQYESLEKAYESYFEVEPMDYWSSFRIGQRITDIHKDIRIYMCDDEKTIIIEKVKKC